MTEVLKLIGVEFYQLIILILVLVLSAIAIKFTITFDLNKYLEDRKTARLNELRGACTHHQVIKDGNAYGLQSFFVSPPGTIMWQCQQCGVARHFSQADLERMTQYYLDNFEEFTKLEKKFQKLVKKNKRNL